MPLSVFVTEVERILRGIPPLDPRARTLQTASGTRDVADAELGYETAARLNAIVVYPMLVEQLEGAALGLANSIKVDTSNPMHREWVSQIDPQVTYDCLGPVINSEGDSSSWFRKVYSRPALSIASTCMAGGVKFPRDMSRSNFPFIATSHGGKKKPIPDDLLYRSFVAPQSLAEAPTSEVILCMEYKTKMALTRDTLANLLQERRLTSDGELLAIPYGWPRNDVVISKETKIITQASARCSF
ncbi:hypothetical protein Hypma_005100 [Hypsizygus marmoreus]|uniref:Uncharacterized protein n=1 Tax=Hypsizygus marmoreus TaxID=39966 RepID=A0A369K2R6_HYPMA|nr:hypothetical protein Hypma_005100 [Hypsizygus marmoreus]